MDSFIPSPLPAASNGDERYCPCCNADLRGTQIPQKYIEEGSYGDRDPSVPHYYQRLIGIEVQGHYDGIAEWLCPDCGARWPRLGINLTDEMLAAIDRDLTRANSRPGDRRSPLAE